MGEWPTHVYNLPNKNKIVGAAFRRPLLQTSCNIAWKKPQGFVQKVELKIYFFNNQWFSIEFYVFSALL